MADPRLLWRRANSSTLKTLRGESGGQYDIRLGRYESITELFSGLPRIVDHEGSRIEITTERVPTEDGSAEIPPYELAIRQMSQESKRSGEWYIRAQRPSSAYPLWRPGVGPRSETAPDTDYVLLARTAGDRFYAGWLRGSEIAAVPAALRKKMEARPIDVASIDHNELSTLISPTTPLPAGDDPGADDAVDEVEQGVTEAQEGREQTVMHVRRERSRRLRAAKIATVAGQPTCEACGFDFAQTYGERGQNFIECHHRISITELDPGVPTKLEDLALLCANCHRMIHAEQPWLTVEELKTLLRDDAR